MIEDKKHNENLYSQGIVNWTRDTVLNARYPEKYGSYRKLWNEDVKSESDIPDFPVQYEIQLVDGCNLRCGICHSRKRTGRKLDIEALKRVIEEGKDSLCAVSVGLDSEGLINKELLLQTLDVARNVGIMDLIVATNGLLLDENYSEELIEAGVTLMNISVDAATADMYQQIRKSSKYDILEKNIKKFVELRNRRGAGLPQIRLSFCKTYLNACEEELFIEKWKNIVDQIDIQNYISTVGEFQDLDKGTNISVDYCKDPFRRVGILANGDVQCCCCSFGHQDIIIGNIYESTMEQIWHGERMRAIQRAFLNDIELVPDYCKTCMRSRYSF